MENTMSFGKVKRKVGRPLVADGRREAIVSVRVTDMEKEIIKQYFGTFDKMRDLVLGIVAQDEGGEYRKLLEQAGKETVKSLLKKASGNVSTNQK